MCSSRSVTIKPKTTLKITAKMKRKPLPTVREDGKSLYNSDLAIYTIVILTAVLSYANSLSGEFVHDDIPAIVTNGDVTGGSPLRELFVNDFWGTPMADVNSHKSYRPLTTLSFRLNYALAGLRPWWWHVCNVGLHATCCVLVARACVTVAHLQRPFAALAALLFAVHPIHTEAVAGVVGRADVLACVLFLSSLLVYHRPSSSKKCVGLSIALGALSMLAKETGVTILLLNLTFDFYRCWPFVRRSIFSLKIEKRSTGLSVRTIKICVSLAFLICVRLALLQGSLPTFSSQDNPAAFHPSFFVRLMTFCYLAAFNWWLLLCPWSLSHDWQMGSVPLVTSGWDPRNVVTFAAFGALLLLCYRCIADIEVQKHTPAVIGLLLLVIPFVPASNLCVTVGFVIAERVLYIPSVGSVIITAYGVQLMWYSRPGTKALLVVGLVILAVSGVAKTVRRNADWRDRATLLRADLATLPQNAKLQYNFGNFLRESEMQDHAIKHYKEALRLWPTYASAHNNIGTLVSGIENAEYHFLQAIKYNRHHVNAHYNLGKLYKKTGKSQEAMRMFEKCVSLQPLFVQAHMELLPLQGEGAKRGGLRRLITLEPRRWEHRVLYGDWLRAQGFSGPASQFYLEAIRLCFGQGVAKSRGDIVAVRLTALMYRATGQKSRILQLLTRWHTWRRGWPSPAAALYLREWHLRMELRRKEELYSRASVHPTKSTTCVDHNQLTVDPKDAITDTGQKKIEANNKSDKSINNFKFNKSGDKTTSDTCGKKRTVSISSQLKTIHNKSESGLKEKRCSLQSKESESRNRVMISAPLVDQVIFKTY